jgi:hypothetical protein
VLTLERFFKIYITLYIVFWNEAWNQRHKQDINKRNSEHKAITNLIDKTISGNRDMLNSRGKCDRNNNISEA